MKTIFALALLASGTVAMASDISLKDAKDLPRISNVSIVVSQPGPYATVEPTVSVKFSHTSCATMKFSADTKDTKDLFLVAIKLDSTFDCMALGRPRDYTVQVASTNVFKPIVVVNPLATISVPALEALPERFCTMDAGVMFNPETKECVGYFNGCHRAELAANGFEFAQGDQCKNEDLILN